MYGIKRTDITVTKSKADELDLKGKRVLVIGGTSGLGRALAHFAAAKGAQVTVAGRTFKDEGKENIKFVKADFTKMAEAARLGRELEAAEVVALTHGIVPHSTREETPDGLEKDMAVSCLSRLVLLRELLPRLAAGSRVFVWGMPGNGTAFAHPDDLNAEKSYEGGFGWVHMNTVGGNEAIVHVLAPRFKDKGVSVFGMNPGLVKTDIRGPLYPAAWLGAVVESILGCFTPSTESYAATTVPLMFAPELEKHTGAMFGQGGDPIKPNKEFETPGKAQEWYDRMEKLVKDKCGI